ncbi:hypothetical protein LCGC14_1890220 [marine sediment metagenome]|uniref:Uncharacterized protein n=1 Tax=marine sediment metagenome TaxID=412755 RepID=A0A0F9IXW8_9ZZZZ
MPKRRKPKKKGIEPNPQKYTWKTCFSLPTFEEANQKRNSLKSEGKLIKVSRRKKGFLVRIGTPIRETSPKNKAL